MRVASVRQAPLRVILLAAPFVLAAHFLEEGPAFVAWFNAHVPRGITEPLFWAVNYMALFITVIVVLVEWFSESASSAALSVAWISLLMFANALLHITGAVVDRAYVPGVVTALLLYLPFSALMIARVRALKRLSRRAVLASAISGATPMLIHGYLIIFRGSRLF